MSTFEGKFHQDKRLFELSILATVQRIAYSFLVAGQDECLIVNCLSHLLIDSFRIATVLVWSI